MKITLTGANEIVKAIKKDLEVEISHLKTATLSAAKSNTPVRSGHAKKNWTAKTVTTGFAVENRVPYIERLEKGYSKKAPNGIIGPTLTQIKGK